MTNNHRRIINKIDKALKNLRLQFKKHSSLFYTEADIIDYFNLILQPHCNLPITKDKNTKKHMLTHREYPTLCRCNMGGGKFCIKRDSAKTRKGKKYRRGHYDLVVLNPDFIKQYSYDTIKAQRYTLFKKKILDGHKKIRKGVSKPIILYALEFMYIKHYRAKGNHLLAKMTQDNDKLIKIKKKFPGYIGKIMMLVFIREANKERLAILRKKLKWNERNRTIKLITA